MAREEGPRPRPELPAGTKEERQQEQRRRQAKEAPPLPLLLSLLSPFLLPRLSWLQLSRGGRAFWQGPLGAWEERPPWRWRRRQQQGATSSSSPPPPSPPSPPRRFSSSPSPSFSLLLRSSSVSAPRRRPASSSGPSLSSLAPSRPPWVSQGPASWRGAYLRRTVFFFFSAPPQKKTKSVKHCRPITKDGKNNEIASRISAKRASLLDHLHLSSPLFSSREASLTASAFSPEKKQEQQNEGRRRSVHRKVDASTEAFLAACSRCRQVLLGGSRRASPARLQDEHRTVHRNW